MGKRNTNSFSLQFSNFRLLKLEICKPLPFDPPTTVIATPTLGLPAQVGREKQSLNAMMVTTVRSALGGENFSLRSKRKLLRFELSRRVRTETSLRLGRLEG